MSRPLERRMDLIDPDRDATADDVVYLKYLQVSQGTAPSNPASDRIVLYGKDDDFLYAKDSKGQETQLSSVGNQPLQVVSIDDTDSPYSVVANTDLILADATSGNIVINLQALASAVKKILGIKKVDTSSNTITLTPNALETIDGETSVVMTGTGGMSLDIYPSTQWRIV